MAGSTAGLLSFLGGLLAWTHRRLRSPLVVRFDRCINQTIRVGDRVESRVTVRNRGPGVQVIAPPALHGRFHAGLALVLDRVSVRDELAGRELQPGQTLQLNEDETRILRVEYRAVRAECIDEVWYRLVPLNSTRPYESKRFSVDVLPREDGPPARPTATVRRRPSAKALARAE